MAKSYTTLTAPAVTNLASLASAAYWVSPVTDNNAALAHEVETLISILTTTSAGTTGTIDVYITGSVDGGTVYSGGVTTESDATYTPTGDDVSEWDFLGSFTYTTETTARTLQKRFSLFDVPKNFKYVIYNGTGTGLGATVTLNHNAIKHG
jgi:hypothetical protein